MSELRARRRTRTATESAYTKAQQENKRALYHCNYCHKDISNEVRIKCADCQDFDLCLDCFAVGAEVTPHKNAHRYRVVDNLSFPILHPDWGADEELLLLEGIDVYGFGNWAAVSEHVGTKGRDACRDHYFATYVDGPAFPLPSPAPEMAKVDVRKLAAQARAGGGRKRQRLDPQQLQAANADNPATLKGGTAAAAATAAPATPGAAGEAAAAGTPAGAAAAGVGSPGSKHKRLKTNAGAAAAAGGAGAAAAAAAPSPAGGAAGTPQHKGFAGAAPGTAAATGPPGASSLGPSAPGGGKALPAAGGAAGSGKPGWDITGWHAKRGEFDFEYDQDAEMAISEMEFKEDDSPLDISHKLKMLEIYNKRLDERERRRDFILEHGLLDVRRMQGLETRRLPHERDQYAQMRVFARYLPPDTHTSLLDGLLAENRLRARIAELQVYRRAGLRTFTEVEEGELERVGGKSKAAQAAADDAAGTASAAAFSAHAAAAGPASRAAAAALHAWRTRRGVPLDICGLPGTEHLCAKERELCAAARILPAHYLSLKDVMMRDAEAHGFISRQDARTYFRMDPSKSLRLYDLMLAAGWLGPIPPALLAGNAPGAKMYRQILANLNGGGAAGPGGGSEGGGSEGGAAEEEEGGEGEEGEGEEVAEEEVAAPAPAPPVTGRRRSSGLRHAAVE